MREEIQSVGIDIGTSTTQLIFSRLIIENQASSYTVPKIDIVEKIIEYRSHIYPTPLLSPTEIDAQAVQTIVEQEYKAANKIPADLDTGAVIITGETARKTNAQSVLAHLSEMAGDFVVATAGPDLESVLSARGAGADDYSLTRLSTVANIDVGGGTTNIGVFNRGKVHDVACLDIGGRLVTVEQGTITYVFPKIAKLAQTNRLTGIVVGQPADVRELRVLCDRMADELAQSLNLMPQTRDHGLLYTNEASPLGADVAIDAVTFSGGVADFVYPHDPTNWDTYGDIGVLLGQAIGSHPAFASVTRLQAKETIRATVVGAGTHSTEISGSTIMYDDTVLPLQNIPVIQVESDDEQSSSQFITSVTLQQSFFTTDGKQDMVALGLGGHGYTTFSDIQTLAHTIVTALEPIIDSPHPIIVVMEHDIAKALGHALRMVLRKDKPIICIDNIATRSGDYVDIGEPIGSGRVVPVVIKTLIFNS